MTFLPFASHFTKSFMGYDREQVDNFLLLVNQEWEKIRTEKQALLLQLELKEEKLSNLLITQSKMDNMAEGQRSEILREVEREANYHIEQAQEKIIQLVEKSRKEAENILMDARTTSQRMISQAEEKSNQILEDSQRLKIENQESIQHLENYKSLLINDLKSLMIRLKEGLDKIENTSTQPLENHSVETNQSYDAPQNEHPSALVPEPELEKIEEPLFKEEPKISLKDELQNRMQEAEAGLQQLIDDIKPVHNEVKAATITEAPEPHSSPEITAEATIEQQRKALEQEHSTRESIQSEEKREEPKKVSFFDDIMKKF